MLRSVHAEYIYVTYMWPFRKQIEVDAFPRVRLSSCCDSTPSCRDLVIQKQLVICCLCSLLVALFSYYYRFFLPPKSVIAIRKAVQKGESNAMGDALTRKGEGCSAQSAPASGRQPRRDASM